MQIRTSVSRKAAKRAKKNNDRSLKKPLALDKKCMYQVLVYFPALRPSVYLKLILSLRLCVFARKWFFIEVMLLSVHGWQ